MYPVNLEDVAIVGSPVRDNVAVVAVDFLDQGAKLRYGTRIITMSKRVHRGQSFAILPIQRGELYITLGDPFGIASHSLQQGDSIEESDFSSELPRLDVEYRENRPAVVAPELAVRTFKGFARGDGSVGIRNYVGIVTSGMCSSTEAREVAWRAMREVYSREKYPNVDGVVAVVHESGCGMPDGPGLTLLNQLLANTLRHPNLCSAIYLDLGCGKTCTECSVPFFQEQVPNYKRRVVNMTIQQAGGSRRTVLKALEALEGMLEYADQCTRRHFPISRLVVGTKCGGSDRWSGLTANPAVGFAADMFVRAGAAVLLPEIPELQGAAMIDLVRRARTPEVGHKLIGSLERFRKYVEMFGEDFSENPTPGNKKGGLYNIYLKSIGAKAKGGSTTVEDLLEYGEWIGDRKGLYVLYTPGYDQISTPALFLSGAHIALFTTGRGTGIGNALGPVVKISSNTQLWKNNEDIDINAGTVLDRVETVDEVGRRIFEDTLAVASGENSARAEQVGFHTEFKVWESLWPAI